MAIQPIDLQTLFAQLSHIGKDLSAHTEASHIAQTVQAAEIAKRSLEQDSSVTETRRLEQGPESIRDSEKRKTAAGSGEEKKQDRRKGKPEKPVFEDPDLGQKIDLSG